MGRPTVTLTTDWGDKDFFAGMTKGLLMSLIDDVRIVDITHHLDPYNIMTATFAVRQACLGFPPGTVHIIDVASRPPFLCLLVRNQFFLCADNGLPYMVFGDEIEDMAELPLQEGGIYNFAAYNLFPRVSAMLLRGATMREIGPRPAQIVKRTMQRFILQGDEYRIYVHYIDSYGNAYLGMSFSEFEEIRAGRPFIIRINEHEVTEFSTSYYNQRTDPRQKLTLTVSVTGLLELALRESSLAQLTHLRVGGSVILRFRKQA